MLIYTETKNGGFKLGDLFIPNVAGNRDHDEMRQLIQDGQAQIASYSASYEERAQEIKTQRDISLSQVVVNVSGADIWANPSEEQNISGKIREMESLGKSSCKWIQGTVVHQITLEELKTVHLEGTKKCAQIFDDYIAAIEAL